jgi:hypothetical protein
LLIISFCLSSVPALYSPTIKNTVTADNYTYRLIMYDNFFDTQMQHYLVECWQDSIYCETVSPVFSVSGASDWPTQLLYDENTDELHIFIRGVLIYTYGNTSRKYNWEDGVRVSKDAYDLYSFQVEDNKLFRLTKCDKDTCEFLSFDYTSRDKPKGNLVFDEYTQELLILFDGVVSSAYGKDSRHYEHLGTVDSSNNLTNPENYIFPMIYSLSSYEESGVYKYMLFECNSPLGWCRLLPFRYSLTHTGKVNLLMNSDDTELQIYIDNELIYAYSEDALSHCYVEGCKIIESDY